ncbi:hypothetical protein [Actinomyces gaoshouyii]|uniref:Uncharacterized protein n=1 Tax=Actinomyces gaoshouyii TaxID=1960083 RepID=A0A8H9HA60_9ACTO|nr:hypothetical protein [Actinomyces gaoshouyii]GGO99581.1 hypothetical protein GCM10011612_17180 [Actinomyces gaoshouyii]
MNERRAEPLSPRPEGVMEVFPSAAAGDAAATAVLSGYEGIEGDGGFGAARPGPAWHAVMLAWIWRAAIIGLAGYGLWHQLEPALRADGIVGGHALVLQQLRFFTTLSNAVALVAMAGALLEPLVGRTGAFSLGMRALGQRVRGLAVVMTVFTRLVFGFLKDGFDEPISWIPHLALPAADAQAGGGW